MYKRDIKTASIFMQNNNVFKFEFSIKINFLKLKPQYNKTN